MMVKYLTMKVRKVKIGIQEEISAGIATYYANPLQGRLRWKNILTQRARIDATFHRKIHTFKLFYRPVIIFFTVRKTNRKVRNVRHQHGLLPNSIHKDLTVEKVEAVIAIMIRPGLDRDIFTYLPRLWDPIDSRPFYRIIIALNWFKFLFGCIRFDNYLNRPGRLADKKMIGLLLCEKCGLSSM